MMITFTSEKVWNHLTDTGFVYTFSKDRRKTFKIQESERRVLVCLIDWASRGRGKPKLTNITIHEIGEIPTSDLIDYVQWSGFESLPKWHDEIQRLDNSIFSSAHKGWLYKVTLYDRDQRALETISKK